MSTARVLRDLDETAEAIAGLPRADQPGAAARPRPGGAFVQAHPLFSGVLLGAGVVGLVAALVIWAQADARPDPEAAQTGGPSGRPTDFRGQPDLPPQLAQRADELRQSIEADPHNLDAMRSLMQLLLASERPFDAFQTAEQLLAAAPEDPDGRYVSGVVRSMMGQTDLALSELGRALQSEAGHERAALVRGLLLFQLGDREGAVATWQGANAARESTRLQRLLAMVEEGRSIEEIIANPF